MTFLLTPLTHLLPCVTEPVRSTRMEPSEPRWMCAASGVWIPFQVIVAQTRPCTLSRVIVALPDPSGSPLGRSVATRRGTALAAGEAWTGALASAPDVRSTKLAASASGPIGRRVFVMSEDTGAGTGWFTRTGGRSPCHPAPPHSRGPLPVAWETRT